MKYLKKFNEKISFDGIDEKILHQALGLLKNPKNEILGSTNVFKTSDISQITEILKDMFKGVEPDKSNMVLVEPVLQFIMDLNERSKKDQSVVVNLNKFQKDGEKEMGVMSKVKELFPKREKNPLMGK
jgi:hypothetical protein